MRRVHVAFSFPWPLTAAEMRELLNFSFQMTLASYLVLNLLEYIRPGFVTLFVDLNDLLWLAIILGIFSSLWLTAIPEARPHPPRSDLKGRAWLILLALVGTGIVWNSVRRLGWLSVVIAVVSGLLIFGLGFLVYLDTDEPTGK